MAQDHASPWTQPDEFTLGAEWYDAVYIHGAARESDDIAWYLSLHERHPGPVLEVGCGTGRVGLELLRRGATYAGVDLSSAMLDRFRKKAAACGLPEPDLTCRSMTDPLPSGPWALVISPFRAFCHLWTVEEQLAALTHIWRVLQPGGVIAFDVFMPRYQVLARADRMSPLELDCTVSDLESGDLIERYVQRVVHRRVQIFEFRTELHVTDAEGRLRTMHETFRQRYFFPFEVRHLVERAGFVEVSVFGDYHGTPHDGESTDLVVVARKADA